ncbi:MAG: hypothetical protein AB8H86_06600 [Polyangiales bacterium]
MEPVSKGCGDCGSADVQAGGLCGACNARWELSALSASQRATLDAMVIASERIRGIKFVREALECSLGDAVRYFGVRYGQLREEGAAFPVEHEEYWKGFYS